MQIVRAAEEVARKKGCSVVQVALAWVSAQEGVVGTPVIPIPGTASNDRLRENTTQTALSEEDFKELEAALKRNQIQGARYLEGHTRLLSV